MKIKEDRIKKTALRLSAARPRGDCPADEVLAAWAEGGLSEAVREKWLGHLARCADCRETLLSLKSLQAESGREEQFEVPAPALSRARQLDPSRKGLVEIVVRFAKGLAEVLSLSGGVQSGRVPLPAAARGESRVISETLVSFVKEFPPYSAEVEIEKVKPDRGEITVRLNEPKNGRLSPGLRVSLFAGDEELESEAVEQGSAVFENVKFGRYRLEITKVGEPVGKIALEMKGEGK